MAACHRPWHTLVERVTWAHSVPGPNLPTPRREVTAVDKSSSKTVAGPSLPAPRASGPQATDHSWAQVGSLFIDQTGASGIVGVGIPFHRS